MLYESGEDEEDKEDDEEDDEEEDEIDSSSLSIIIYNIFQLKYKTLIEKRIM